MASQTSKRNASARKRANKSTQNSGIDRRKQNKGRIENLQPFKSKAENGGQIDARINVGGLTSEQRKLAQDRAAAQVVLSEAYLKYLALAPNPKFIALLSDWGAVPQTNAEIIAASQIQKAASGDVPAAREIARATEGERIRTWRDDVIDLLREGKVSPEQVKAELSELGSDVVTAILVAAGIRRNENGETESARDPTNL